MAQTEPRIRALNASGKWTAPLVIDVEAGGYELVVDHKPEIGGTGQGPSPMDLVMAAVIGCAGQTLAFIARQMDFKYSAATFEADAGMDLRGYLGVPGICKHFCSFRGTFVIETEESAERLKALTDMVDERCPVLSLLQDAGVHTQIEWRKA